MRVTLQPPVIADDTVTWAWAMSEPNPYQTTNAFFIRYVGLDPHVYSDTLWLEIWLALMARVLRRFEPPVNVDLPSPLPQASIDYWLARHSATGHIVVRPADSDGYSPWRAQPVHVGDHPIGITFGGGKDSLCTLAMTQELYGAAPSMLLHLFAPFPTWPRAVAAYVARMERYALRPLEARTGVAVGRVITDYRSNLVERHRELTKSHLELFTMAGMPMLLAHQVETLTLSEPWGAAAVASDPDEPPFPRKLSQRPESMDLEWLHYRRTLGVDQRMVNAGLVHHSLTPTTMLARRYPELLPYVMTCERTTRPTQFCYHCHKCAMFGIFLLGLGLTPDWFDIDAMLANDTYWADLADAAKTAGQGRDGNAPMHPVIGLTGPFQEVCHSLHAIDPATVSPALGPVARERLELLCQLWGNAPYPVVLESPRQVTAWSRHPLIDALSDLVGRSFPVTDSFSGPVFFGDLDVHFDPQVRHTPRTTAVAHLQPPLSEQERSFIVGGGRRMPPFGVTPP